MAHAFNPSTREAEAGGSLGVRGQPNIKELVPGQAPKATEKPCLGKPKTKTKTKKIDPETDPDVGGLHL